jgi:hypothetical protein
MLQLMYLCLENKFDGSNVSIHPQPYQMYRMYNNITLPLYVNLYALALYNKSYIYHHLDKFLYNINSFLNCTNKL